METNYSRHKCIAVVSKLVIICNTKELLRLSPLYDILSRAQLLEAWLALTSV